MLCIGEVVSLSAINMDTFRSFLKCIIAKSCDNVNISAKNFKFAAMLIKFSP